MIVLPSYIEFALNRLSNKGYKAYIVGGCVRDYIMKKTPNDYDIATNALPEQIISAFHDCKHILSGVKHGTVSIIKDKEIIEITTYRIDSSYSDNRHPDKVSFTDNLLSDLSRRDFSINAIAMDKDGSIIDVFNGLNDISNKVIRCVGDPNKRFTEDGLRILRGLRFASVLDFHIDKCTSNSIHKFSYLLKNISAERIQTEFTKIICGYNAEKILCDYFDVFSQILPFRYNYKGINKIKNDVTQRLAYLMIGQTNNKILEVASILKLSNYYRDSILFLCNNLNIIKGINKIGIKKLLSVYTTQQVIKLIEFAVDSIGAYNVINVLNEIIYNNEPCRIEDLDINGNDLKSIGYKGKEISSILNNLLNSVIVGICENQKKQLMLQAKDTMY